MNTTYLEEFASHLVESLFESVGLASTFKEAIIAEVTHVNDDSFNLSVTYGPERKELCEVVCPTP